MTISGTSGTAPRQAAGGAGGHGAGQRASEAAVTFRDALIWLATCVAFVLAGCATTAGHAPSQRARLAPPQQPADSIRLFIYRPQTLVGMMGKPAVLVNGRQMGIAGSPVNENLLQPGSVFVVDAPATLARVTWRQSGKAEPDGDEIVYQGLPGTQRYLRWTLKPTLGYLQEVDEAVAAKEIAPLYYNGYVNLTSGQ
jgi:hypothetical protein